MSMFRLIALLAFSGVTLCHIKSVDISRNKPKHISVITTNIIDGEDADDGEFPFIVSLRSMGSHICGGSILNVYHVLTAAHCVENVRSPSDLSVQYGVTQISRYGNVVELHSFIMHPGYRNCDGNPNDLAILKLSSAMRSDTISPVVLPSPYINNRLQKEVATLSGWGFSYTGGQAMESLQKVDLQIYSDSDCASIMSPANPIYNLCAGVPGNNKSGCNGDSGGPLVIRGNVQVGIVSWGTNPCGIGYPGVFTRVTTYVSWIQQQIWNPNFLFQ